MPKTIYKHKSICTNIHLKTANGKFHSHEVRMMINGRRISKNFSLVNYGNEEETLKAAIEYKEKMLEQSKYYPSFNKAANYKIVQKNIYCQRNTLFTNIPTGVPRRYKSISISISDYPSLEDAIQHLLKLREEHLHNYKFSQDGRTLTKFKHIYKIITHDGKVAGYRFQIYKTISKCFNFKKYGGGEAALKAALTERSKYIK